MAKEENEDPQDQMVPEHDESSNQDAADIDAAIDHGLDIETGVSETRDEEMERLRQTAGEADKRVLMAQADAENFRKRMRRDYEDQLKYAAVPVITDVLQVRDNLLRAIDAAGDMPEIAGLKEGVAMVVKQLDDALVKHGVQKIPAEGELFDPNYHEAISQMPSDAPEGMIAHVATTGFQMHERVIRPSQVVVSTGQPEEGSP